MGHTATSVENGALAWETLQKQSFNVVISDWMMPQMDGLELCRHIRTRTSNEYTYFILLTARDQREDKFMGLQAGADDFLIKPLQSDELEARFEVAERLIGIQTQLANTVQNLQVAQRRFSELFMGLPIAGISIDAEGRIQEWNRACEALFGFKESEVFFYPFLETVCPPAMRPRVEERLKCLLNGEPISDFEWDTLLADGSTRHFLWNAIPLASAKGKVVGAINTLIDITRLKVSENKVRLYSEALENQRAQLQEANILLQFQAVTDGLTGLHNHRAFQERLNSEFERAQRHNEPLSLIILDVDSFKQYNDSFGHPEGDEALKTIARLISDNVRGSDYPARYGGEEFVLLLPSTPLSKAYAAAERFRVVIEEHAWELRPITASFGVTTLRPEVVSAKALLAEADEALYHSKQLGRNCITCYTPLEEERLGIASAA
jgi:two-component system cell cycle response regulator